MTNDVKNTFNSTKKEERINKVIALLQKYPRLNSAHAIVTAYKTEYDEEIERSGKAVQLFEIEIEHISGKEIQEK